MDIKVPEVGESVYEARIAKWHKQEGESVRKDEVIVEIETDKITLELQAEADGLFFRRVAEGETVKVGTVIAAIEPGQDHAAPPSGEEKKPQPKAAPKEHIVTPSARKLAREKEAPPQGPVTAPMPADLFSYGKVEQQQEKKPRTESDKAIYVAGELKQVQEGERTTRKPMTPIRKRIAERLLSVRQQTAMLTTFNEADMTRVMELRKRHSDHLMKKHGIGLGFMSFFVKATVEALKENPQVNARIDGDDIVYNHFYDIGIAISGEKGLVVPVLRGADRLTFADIEKKIDEFVQKVKTNRLAIADLEGGTFSITNGGVFGSLLSTPILNPPQSGVLGMHSIQDRPVVRDGKIVARPMMYLALSYDHRIIDGREAVKFLKRIKDYVEEPEELILEA